MFFDNIDWYRFALTMLALVICITVHEFAHAVRAYKAGDDTPRKHGRISLNPFDHLDPIGTMMMVFSSLAGFGIGWGKPVQVNPMNFRHPRRDNLWVSFWGPLSNLITAAVIGIFVLRFWHPAPTDNIYLFLSTLVEISLALALFNLIPVTPLDGSHILASLLPYEQAVKYNRVMAQYGLMIFLGMIFVAPMMGVDILGMVLVRPMLLLWQLFTGLPWFVG